MVSNKTYRQKGEISLDPRMQRAYNYIQSMQEEKMNSICQDQLLYMAKVTCGSIKTKQTLFIEDKEVKNIA